MMLALFIGGQSDGKVVEVDESWVVMRIPRKELRAASYQRDGSDFFVEYDEYRKHFLSGSSSTIPVYCLSNMSPDDMIAALVQGYVSEEKRECLFHSKS